jgi:hypothetical protein
MKIIKNVRLFALAVLALVVFMAFSNKKPKVLIIGDSISIGYTPFVKKYFADKAIISHNPGNAQHTGTGLQNIEEWIAEDDWDIIQFNWGLWDLCYRDPNSKNQGMRDKENGMITYSLEDYAAKLDSIVTIIQEKTDAKLIFVTTSYVPKNEAGRYERDAIKYNKAAIKVMKKHGVTINDIYKKSIAIHNEFGQGSDNVHYTDEGYEMLSKLIIDFLEKEIDSVK